MEASCSWSALHLMGDFNVALNMISNHSPVILKTPNLASPKPKPFKFFNFLAYKSEQIENQIRPGSKGFGLNSNNVTLREEESVYLQAFSTAKLDEEQFLKHKAKVDWLKARDLNTTYFHKTIKSNNNHSRIKVVLNSANQEVLGSYVLEVFVSHYEQFLRTSTICSELNIEGLFLNKLSDLLSSNMIHEVTNEEVKAAMFDIGDDKASSPDGYTLTFFKKGGTLLVTMFAMREDGYEARRSFFSLFIHYGYGGFELILKRRVGFSDAFRYHKHCEELKIINVCFADDLFIFSCRDVESACVILDSLEEFKLTSGLVSSIPKSIAYFCNVLHYVKQAILNIMPFSKGELPVKYIGVPLTSSGLLNKDFKILVEKAKNRI
nr:hypothetical protein [Tanacetum cinerariifolium]